MLIVSTNVSKYDDFKNLFVSTYSDKQLIDLSKVPSAKLADESDSIISHHSNCIIFMGYLEPGWMLEPTHQTRIRKLFRKFPVAIVTNFVESIPFSWKNEIQTFYTDNPLNKNGTANSFNDGGFVQEQSTT